jgi:hypothetical protein
MLRIITAESSPQMITSDSVLPGIVIKSAEKHANLDQQLNRKKPIFPMSEFQKMFEPETRNVWEEARNEATRQYKDDMNRMKADPLSSKSIQPIPKNLQNRKIAALDKELNRHEHFIFKTKEQEISLKRRSETIKLKSMVDGGLSPNIDAAALQFEHPDRKKLAKIRSAIESGNLKPMLSSFLLPQNSQAEPNAKNTEIVSSILSSSSARSDNLSNSK